jgi:hypothetical protein
MASPGSAPAAPAARDDWAAQAADTIDRVVTGLGDKTAKPLTTVAAGIVYGLVIAVVGVALLILVAVAAVRALDSYLPIHPHARAVWIGDGIVGGIFTLAGLLVWRTRRPRRR